MCTHTQVNICTHSWMHILMCTNLYTLMGVYMFMFIDAPIHMLKVHTCMCSRCTHAHTYS